MEGVGSRLGRASSRYGPATSVFNGPVRKWKKKWVHVSPSSTVNYRSSQSNGHSDNNAACSRLLLCKWTPLSSSTSSPAGPENGSGAAEEPARRRFRYTPIAVIEERKKRAAKEEEDDASKNETYQFAAWSASQKDELNINKDLKKETQDPNTRHLDLGLCLKGHNEELDSTGRNKEGPSKTASSSGYWTVG